jgi:hypothetical protein
VISFDTRATGRRTKPIVESGFATDLYLTRVQVLGYSIDATVAQEFANHDGQRLADGSCWLDFYSGIWSGPAALVSKRYLTTAGRLTREPRGGDSCQLLNAIAGEDCQDCRATDALRAGAHRPDPFVAHRQMKAVPSWIFRASAPLGWPRSGHII